MHINLALLPRAALLHAPPAHMHLFPTSPADTLKHNLLSGTSTRGEEGIHVLDEIQVLERALPKMFFSYGGASQEVIP